MMVMMMMVLFAYIYIETKNWTDNHKYVGWRDVQTELFR